MGSFGVDSGMQLSILDTFGDFQTVSFLTRKPGNIGSLNLSALTHIFHSSSTSASIMIVTNSFPGDRVVVVCI